MRTPANEQFQLDQLNDWRMLIDVVKARSMKIAAQNLGVDPSTVTRRIITCSSVLADCDLIGLITDFQKRYPQTYFEIYDTPEEIKGEPDLSYWFGTPACRDKSRLSRSAHFIPCSP